MTSFLKIFLVSLLCVFGTGCSKLKDHSVCEYLEKQAVVEAQLIYLVKEMTGKRGGWTTPEGIQENMHWFFNRYYALIEIRKNYMNETEELMNERVQDVHDYLLKLLDLTIETVEYFNDQSTVWVVTPPSREELNENKKKMDGFELTFMNYHKEMKQAIENLHFYSVLCD